MANECGKLSLWDWTQASNMFKSTLLTASSELSQQSLAPSQIHSGKMHAVVLVQAINLGRSLASAFARFRVDWSFLKSSK